ncbi:tetratricopeptide repeat protein [Pedobacter nyackensis]|uniref:Tfp pilus assembly protein PilF n=1 Tax=Pedobacter nyackensis TaxID=475255 RepID=A0A1W2BDQ6_9SPHI|nr:tetratricopeptide repeat protein [Pedobacter nyackensis]SMC70528.1 Tfp pilus assembly protein PilF [Pedobacter nyackensis]
MSKVNCFVAVLFFSAICFNSRAVGSDALVPQDSVREQITMLNKKAKQLNRDATNQAIAYAYKAYLLAYENKLKLEQADALVILAEGYLYNDIYDLALEYGFNALEIYKENGSPEQIGATYTLLGWTYYDVENAELSLKYHTMAYNLYKKAGNEQKAAVSLNGIGLIYQLMNEFNKAADYFNQVLELAKKFNNKTLISAAYNNLGISSNNTGDYKQAIFYFQLALQYSSGQLLSLAEVHNQMAFSLVKLGNYKEAQQMLDKAHAYIEQSTSNSKKENLLDYYKIFSQLYQLTGDYKHAYEYIQKYNTIREEFLSKNKVNAMLTLTMKREAQDKERQIKALSLEKSLKSYQRNTLAIIVVLLVIIGFLLYNKLRSRQRKNAELAEVKQQLLSNKLEFNNVELKNYSMYMSHRNEVIGNFMEELTVLEKSGGDDVMQRLHKLVNKFRYDVNSEKYIEDFNLQIEAKYQDFFYNLQQKFPTLTQNERRLCAQIRLNLSIKEIASLNNISVKSVEMARYRLRKHFGLSTNDSLNDFLKSF